MLLIRTYQGSVPTSTLSNDALNVGLAAFGVGEIGNLYHHYILSTLRKDGPAKSNSSAKKDDSFDIKANYSVPTGGLFDYVTMPHYFFELVAWLGIACVSQDANVYLVFASMFTYLLTRAKATKVWYLKNVDNYPKSRNVLLPFVL